MHSYLYVIINNLEGKRVAYYKLFALCMTEELKCLCMTEELYTVNH